jgi:hypothetical protein
MAQSPGHRTPFEQPSGQQLSELAPQRLKHRGRPAAQSRHPTQGLDGVCFGVPPLNRRAAAEDPYYFSIHLFLLFMSQKECANRGEKLRISLAQWQGQPGQVRYTGVSVLPCGNRSVLYNTWSVLA